MEEAGGVEELEGGPDSDQAEEESAGRERDTEPVKS